MTGVGATPDAVPDGRPGADRPLQGCSVVVTRSADQAPELARRLRELGAEVVCAPTIRIADPDDGGAALRAAVAGVHTRDWVVLTSPNGAARFVEALGAERLPGSVRVAVVGPGTAAVVSDHGMHVDLVPPRAVAESLLDVFPPLPPGGGRVLVVRAAVARDVLPDGLAERGWAVEVVEAYRTVPERYDAATRSLVRSADVVAFTSSSTVTHFVSAMGGNGPAVEEGPGSVACIGPVTAATARDAGFEVTVEATPHSVEGLVAAVVEAWAVA